MGELLSEAQIRQLVTDLVEHVLQLVVRRGVEVMRGRGGAVPVQILGCVVV